MASSASSKKQIVESIKESTNILVTVSNNPSVDELSAALGLTIFLNNLGKHATAVASGEMPPAITFLEPDKTFEATAHSLQDFIIALDKEKADHLRYKVEGGVVKIFITPYRTTISSDDLEFSQGDYNVELVLALNVASEKDLDRALSAHGKILHDATVGSLTAGDIKSELGTVGWHEKSNSGISEMVTELIGELKTPKAALDEQIATALLTGIVAATDRFSNDATSSKVMTMAAELMAAGANQQLIVSELQSMSEEAESTSDFSSEAKPEQEEPEDSTTLKVNRDKSAVVESGGGSVQSGGDTPSASGPSIVDGDTVKLKGYIEETARQVMHESQEDAAKVAEVQLGEIMAGQQQVSQPPGAAQTVSEQQTPGTQDIVEDLRRETEAVNNSELPTIQPSVASVSTSQIQPTVGGTLNATTSQAAADKRREIEQSTNRTILTHGKPLASQEPATQVAPLNAAMAESEEPPLIDIFSTPPNSQSRPSVDAQSLGVISNQQQALDDVNAALMAQPQPVASDFTTDSLQVQQTPPTIQEIESGGQVPGAAVVGQPAFPAGSLAMPDFSSLPPLPPAPTGVDLSGMPTLPSTSPADTNAPQPAPTEFNPSQFQIPNQP